MWIGAQADPPFIQHRHLKVLKKVVWGGEQDFSDLPTLALPRVSSFKSGLMGYHHDDIWSRIAGKLDQIAPLFCFKLNNLA